MGAPSPLAHTARMKKKVFILEDKEADRAQILAELAAFPELDPAEPYSDPAEFTAAILKAGPDLAIVDLLLEKKHAGLGCIASIRAANPSIHIIANTCLSDARTLLFAHHFGANDCAVKGSAEDTLSYSVSRFLKCEEHLNPILARAVEREYRARLRSGEVFAQLTEIEVNILHEVANGKKAKEIAAQFNIHTTKVENCIKKIRRLLGDGWMTAWAMPAVSKSTHTP